METSLPWTQEWGGGEIILSGDGQFGAPLKPNDRRELAISGELGAPDKWGLTSLGVQQGGSRVEMATCTGALDTTAWAVRESPPELARGGGVASKVPPPGK